MRADSGLVKTAVIIPTYNEADNIVALLTAVRAALPEATVLVVDDNSPDHTAAAVAAVATRLGNVEVLHRSTKEGLGSALRAGMRWAIAGGYEVYVQMDADGSHDPAELPALVNALTHGADLAIGSRYVAGGMTPRWPWSRRCISRAGNLAARTLLRLRTRDTTSGYRAYSTTVLQSLRTPHSDTTGYAFQIEMVYRMERAGGRVVELPIVFRDRTRGESKMSPAIAREAAAFLVQTAWADLWGRGPYRVLHPEFTEPAHRSDAPSFQRR